MGTETWRPWKHLRVFETIILRPRWFSESALLKEVKTLIYAKVLSKRMQLEHWSSLLRPSRKEKGDSEIYLPIPAEPTPPAHSANEYCICIVCPSMSTKIWMINLLSALVQGLAQSTKLRRWVLDWGPNLSILRRNCWALSLFISLTCTRLVEDMEIFNYNQRKASGTTFDQVHEPFEGNRH